jgi:hypothetical protein
VEPDTGWIFQCSFPVHTTSGTARPSITDMRSLESSYANCSYTTSNTSVRIGTGSCCCWSRRTGTFLPPEPPQPVTDRYRTIPAPTQQRLPQQSAPSRASTTPHASPPTTQTSSASSPTLPYNIPSQPTQTRPSPPPTSNSQHTITSPTARPQSSPSTPLPHRNLGLSTPRKLIPQRPQQMLLQALVDLAMVQCRGCI